MDQSIDINELQTEINRFLPPEQQIQKSDPLFTGVLLNRVVFNAYVRFMQGKLDEAVQQITAASEQQTERAARISETLIAKAGIQIQSQVDTAARHWEDRLQRVNEDGDASIRRACRVAWIGAVVITICACAMAGSFLGNLAFQLIHHSYQRHR